MPCENSARKRSKTMAFRCTPEEHKLIGFVAVSYTHLTLPTNSRV